jgi:hypothetical protein
VIPNISFFREYRIYLWFLKFEEILIMIRKWAVFFGTLIDLLSYFSKKAYGAKMTSTAHTFKRFSRYD